MRGGIPYYYSEVKTKVETNEENGEENVKEYQEYWQLPSLDASDDIIKKLKKTDPQVEDFDREKYVKEKVAYESKKEYYDRGVLTVSIASIKAELGKLYGEEEEIDKDGAQLPLMIPQAMRTRRRPRVGANPVPLNRPRPGWLGRSGLMTEEQAEARDAAKMTKAEMDAAAEKRYEELVKHDDAATLEEDMLLWGEQEPPLDDEKRKQMEKDHAVARAYRKQQIKEAAEALALRKKGRLAFAKDDYLVDKKVYEKDLKYKSRSEQELYETYKTDRAIIEAKLEARFDSLLGDASLLPDGVQEDDCLIKSILVKKEIAASSSAQQDFKYKISAAKFMDFFRKVNEAIKGGVGAASLELMIERMVAESVKRSQTAVRVMEDEIKDSKTWLEKMAPTAAAKRRVHDDWWNNFQRVFANMGVSEAEVKAADKKMPEGLTHGKLARNLTRRLWRGTLSALDKREASWDEASKIGTTFGLASIFSSVGGKTLPQLLTFLCDVGLVSIDKQSEFNLYAPKTQFEQYGISMKGVKTMQRHEPEEAFRAIWVWHQMAPHSEWKDELEKKLQVRTLANRETREAVRQAENDYFEQYKQSIGDDAWKEEVKKERANAKAAITRRNEMVPYKDEDALVRAQNNAMEKAVARLVASIRKEGRDQFYEKRNVLKYAEELWKKRVLARAKKIPESAADRPSGYLELGPRPSSGSAYEPVGYEILAKKIAKLEGVKHPEIVTRRIKEAVDERIKAKATEKAPFPTQAPTLETSAADAEAYEVKVAQHYAAVQMETQNFTAPENWITEDTTELTMDKMEAKRNEEIMVWLLKNIRAILSDLQPGTNATPYSREVRIGLVNALAAAQRDVYRMRYEMGSIKERADQALRRQRARLNAIPTYAIIPEVPPAVLVKLYEIAKGDITAQTAERNPETGRRADAKIRYTDPQRAKDRDVAKQSYQEKLDEYIKSKEMTEGLTAAMPTDPTEEDRAQLDSAISVTKELWEAAREQRREYEIADGKYREELDSMINALFDQEESMRQNADYTKRKGLFQYWEKTAAEDKAALDAVPRDARTGEAYEKKRKLAEESAKKKESFADPDATTLLKRRSGEDRFGTPEEKRKECREMIGEMIATNMRRKWWNNWLNQNQQVDVEEFKMVLFDENCREYVDDILDSFNTFFEEGIIVLKNDESTQELRKLADEATQLERYRSWQDEQDGQAIQNKLSRNEELTDDELMFIKGFDPYNVPTPTPIDQEQLAMELEVKRRVIAKRKTFLEEQRDSLDPIAPDSKRQQVDAERKTLRKILTALDDLKQDADVSEAVLNDWVHPRHVPQGSTARVRAVNRKVGEEYVDRVAEQLQTIESTLNKKIGELNGLNPKNPEDDPRIQATQAAIADLQKQRRDYMQVIEWGTPFEGQPNRSDQVKDSFANAIARVKRQIYFVDVILGDPIKYGTPGENGLATKEQVLAEIDPAPEERFRLDKMVRSAAMAQRAKDRSNAGKAKESFEEAKKAYEEVLRNSKSTPEQLRRAKAKKDAAQQDAFGRWDVVMPDLKEIEMFPSSSVLDRAMDRLERLLKAQEDGQGSSQGGQSSLESDINRQLRLVAQLKDYFVRYRSALMQQMAVLTAAFSSDQFATTVSPSLAPYAQLDIRSEVDAKPSEDTEGEASMDISF